MFEIIEWVVGYFFIGWCLANIYWHLDVKEADRHETAFLIFMFWPLVLLIVVAGIGICGLLDGWERVQKIFYRWLVASFKFFDRN